MTLEQQVTSLELSKKLKEVGVEQNSLFFWREIDGVYDLRLAVRDVFRQWASPKDETSLCVDDAYSAFTVAELGEMLPKSINIPYKNGNKRPSEHDVHFYYSETMSTWQINYIGSSYVRPFVQAATEANARAKMLIYLLENKLI